MRSADTDRRVASCVNSESFSKQALYYVGLDFPRRRWSVRPDNVPVFDITQKFALLGARRAFRRSVRQTWPGNGTATISRPHEDADGRSRTIDRPAVP